nr:uncharacterized protein LOC117838379 [Setaria viridis]
MSIEVAKGPSRKKTKKPHNKSDAASGDPNLRVRSKKNRAEIVEEQIDEDIYCDSIGDFLGDNEDLDSGPQRKRKGRGITKLDDIFGRSPTMPKIKIMVNEYGQPIGQNARKFSSAIGCQVRRTISVACPDWRLVDAEKKFEVWTNIKAIYDIDDAAYNWFMDTAGRKWKEFKSTLKELYFSGKLSDEELKEKHADRVNAAEWNFLIDYWMTPECQNRTEICKENRGKLRVYHTSGSKSFACSRHELGEKLGRPARRDEVYIKTHTRKNGVPTTQAEPIINKLKDIVEVYPELKERTIEEGELFATVCGEKKPRGRVRGLGLGPTPQEVGTPGLRNYKPTRLQMEILARKKLEIEKNTLERRIVEMEEAHEEERMARHNADHLSQHGSNSRPHSQSPRSEGHVDEENHDAESEDDGSDHNAHSDVEELLLANRRSAAPSVQQPPRSQQCSPTSVAPATLPRNDVTCSPHEELVGKEVILYAMLRSELPVAKGTIMSTNPNTMVGGQVLGKQYCEVIVNLVLKRDAILPRPYAEMSTMADAQMMSIAWPYRKLKVSKASKSFQGAAASAGSFGRNARRVP